MYIFTAPVSPRYLGTRTNTHCWPRLAAACTTGTDIPLGTYGRVSYGEEIGEEIGL